ncbi:hypothetical protein M5K25_026823 [Dendrobium thyrsiflorum]|uniref:Uncharacterized protein n=1 Tax=Dendrobium thyrsiflorum TaxID=117978 RepID=A0ABD0TYG1_DENTH
MWEGELDVGRWRGILLRRARPCDIKVTGEASSVRPMAGVGRVSANGSRIARLGFGSTVISGSVRWAGLGFRLLVRTEGRHRLRLRAEGNQTAFPSCWNGSCDILIGSQDGSLLAVKVTFFLSWASSTKSREPAKPKEGRRRIYSTMRFTGRSGPVW